MLSDTRQQKGVRLLLGRLNAPFGARCFLTSCESQAAIRGVPGLNAPFGARCFLTSMPRRGLAIPNGMS